MIPAVPLPGLTALLCHGFLGHPAGPALAAPWLQAGDHGALWLSRSAWSLAAIADAFKAVHCRPPIIAVPEYICNQSLWPLRQGRAVLTFLPMRSDKLELDWMAMDDVQADLLLLVHYFGTPADCAAARAWCAQRGALLIEDGAHALEPAAGIGSAGDLVLYSPHKLLAAPDGAVLVVRPGAATLEPALADAVRGLGWAHPSTRIWRLKRLIQASPLGALLRPGGQPDFLTDPETQAMECRPMTSPAGAALIARADLAAVARTRRQNAARIGAAIAPLADWQMLSEPSEGVVPYRLVLRCSSPAAAIDLYQRLRQAGVPVESWPDLPPEAGPAALIWRQTLLLLPCHQSIDPDRVIAAVRKALT